ncbi:hypothetical protein FQN49_005791 [Arthroderma sp. PD_2]|nr:hypothetical protein FQN49_005791 [Arthroderma sp. PD_2]
MSFGFSPSDVFLAAKISYNFYKALSHGGEAVNKELRGLRDVLYSLHCALDHLSDKENSLRATTSAKCGETDSHRLPESLNTVVAACKATLDELDDATKKYRDTLEDGSGLEKTTAERMKQRFQVNWRRIRWDMEKSQLADYTRRLQVHSDAINMLVVTSLYKATREIEVSKAGESKMIAEMHRLLSEGAVPREACLISPGPGIMAVTTTGAPGRAASSFTAQNHTRTVPLFKSEMPTTKHTVSDERAELNERRKAAGLAEYNAYMAHHSPPAMLPPYQPPGELPRAEPTTRSPKLSDGLLEGIMAIFHPLQDTIRSQAAKYREQRRADILHSEVSSSKQDEYVDLLIRLNELTEKNKTDNGEVVELFYHCVKQGALLNGIKLLNDRLELVRAMKEVEEFEDEMDEWERR